MTLAYFAILLRPQNIELFGFPIFRFWVYLMKIIPEKMVDTKFDIYMILSVPDEDYSRKGGAH